MHTLNRPWRRVLSESGFTLVEVMVVVAIIGILLTLALMSFQGWRGTYAVESQIKQLHIDLMNTRARAMQRNRSHFFSLISSTSYSIFDDDTDGTVNVPDGDGILQPGTDTQLPTFPKLVEYPIVWDNTATAANIEFLPRGLASVPAGVDPAFSVYFDGDGDGFPDFDSDYDCVKIEETRIKLGKLCDNLPSCKPPLKTALRSDDVCITK